MSGEALLFVRKASGLRRAITPWQALLFCAPSLAPWHYYVMAHMPYWYPGIMLPTVYFIGGLLVLIECISMSLIYVAMPRSGSIYVPLSRAVSPMLGIMEATRSFVTNPIFRGATAFMAAGQLINVFAITGLVTQNEALANAATAAAANIWLLFAIALIFQIIGTLVDGLGPGILGWWQFIWGIGVFLGWAFVVGSYLSVPAGGLQARWDATFGPGAYDEIMTLSADLEMAPLTWEASLSAFLLPVSSTFPYVIAPVTGEVQEPSKSIPLSMAGGAVIILFVNTVITWAYTSAYGEFAIRYIYCVYNKADQFKINRALPIDLATLAAAVAPNSAIAGISSFAPQPGNFADMTLNCAFTSRPLFALAIDRMGPEIFTKVHPKWHSPYFGSIYWFVLSVVTAFLAAIGYNVSIIFGIGWVYMFARLMQHWSEIELPIRRPEIWERGLKITVAGFPLMTILGSISATIALYVLTTSTSAVLGGLMIAVVYFIGAIWFGYYGWRNLKKGIPPARIYGEVPPE